MPSNRSRQGCDECRRRRRKCDESKPTCGSCLGYKRKCKYTLHLVWGNTSFAKPCSQRTPQHQQSLTRISRIRPSTNTPGQNGSGLLQKTGDLPTASPLSQGPLLPTIPHQLPNGVPMPPRYRILLDYLIKDVLASLSCHTTVHQDLCRGLIPAMLHSPHLLSAGLALSAAGFLSRGLVTVDGVDTLQVMNHLQSSGLSLLRSTLSRGQVDEVSLSTCIIWCLVDIFSARQGASSWQIHLQGVKAMIDSHHVFKCMVLDPGTAHSDLKHLYQLYLSLQTLPHIPSLAPGEILVDRGPLGSDASTGELFLYQPNIDGFLGYSQELLAVLQRIGQLTASAHDTIWSMSSEANGLLIKVKTLIDRDETAPPEVSISSDLSDESRRDFGLCNKVFQQATLIHLYRRLFNLPSSSDLIQTAFTNMVELINSMTQGKPCHTWVAMGMPLFTMGCEAFNDWQKSFVLDKVNKFEVCLGSLHVGVVRQALEDIWKLRLDQNDYDGNLCAEALLKEVRYSIILF